MKKYKVIKAQQSGDETLVKVRVLDGERIFSSNLFMMPELGELYIVEDIEFEVKSVTYQTLRTVTLHCKKFIGIRKIKGQTAFLYGRKTVLL